MSDELIALRKRCAALEGALRYVLEDDGLIPRASSACRKVVRDILNSTPTSPGVVGVPVEWPDFDASKAMCGSITVKQCVESGICTC